MDNAVARAAKLFEMSVDEVKNRSTISGAVDPEDGPLTVRWTSTLMHCAESSTCHLHPGPESTGAGWGGSFPDHPDARLQITATVQDSAGVHVSRSYIARPREHRLTLVSTTPAVLSIQLYGGGLFPRTSLSAAKRERHSPSLRITTCSAPGRRW